jgi:hypothetical protein
MLLLAALLLAHSVAAEAPSRSVDVSLAAALERQAQLAVHPAGRLEMRSTSGTAGSRQEAAADYAARLTDALVGGQPPAPHRTTAGTPATAATPQPLPSHPASSGSTLPAPFFRSEKLIAAAPASQYTTTTASYPARQKLAGGGISPTTAASLASEAMLRELVAEAAEAAAATATLALPPTQVAVATAANNTPSAPAGTTWSAELIFDKNASSFGFSNRWGAVHRLHRLRRVCLSTAGSRTQGC